MITVFLDWAGKFQVVWRWFWSLLKYAEYVILELKIHKYFAYIEGAKSIIYGWKFEVTFLLELLLNQWNRSTRKSSTSKSDTSENRSTGLFAVLEIMWQGQPFINIFLFFANTRVVTEFFFPIFTAVLSSPTAAQFSQSILFSLRMESMLLKSTSLHTPISKS